MRNDGNKLKSLMKSKGYDIVRLSNTVKVSTVAIQKDFHKTELTRRTLVKYVPTLLPNVDDFYKSDTQSETIAETTGAVPVGMYADLQAKYIALLEKHLELTQRFFPNAVQSEANA